MKHRKAAKGENGRLKCIVAQQGMAIDGLKEVFQESGQPSAVQVAPDCWFAAARGPTGERGCGEVVPKVAQSQGSGGSLERDVVKSHRAGHCRCSGLSEGALCKKGYYADRREIVPP